MSLPPHPGVQIESDEVAWSGRFGVDIVKFRHRRFDGGMSGLRTWELFRRGRAAAVLPYDPATDQVLLIEQFRLPALAAGLEPVMVEVPAGLCDGDEDPVETAAREVGEETGLHVRSLELICDILLTPGASDERCTLFVGRMDAPTGPLRNGGLASENEDIRVRLHPAETVIAAAIAGQYPNSVTAIALLWLAAQRQALRARWLAA